MILGFLEDKKGLAVGIAIACFVIAGVIQFTGREEPVFPPKAGFFCVETGEIFWIDPTKTTAFPMKNPDTGKRTVLPYETRDGALFITARSSGHIKRMSEVNNHVDPDTFECRLPE